MASVVYPGLPRPVDIAGIFNATDQGFKAGQDWRDNREGEKAFGAYLDSLKTSQGASQGLSGLAPVAQPQQPDLPTQRVASAFGDTPSPLNGYYSALRSAESSGNDAAANPNSSATGRYQFTKGTWDGLMTAHPELGLTPAGITDPGQQERAVRALTAQNAKSLSSAGIKVNPGNLYAAHFLGAGGAGNVLKQQDSTPMSALVSPEVIQANPQLANMTVGDFKQWTAAKVGGGAPAASPAGVQVADASGGMPSMPSANPASILPPPEVMRALFKSKETRPLAIGLAQSAIKLRANQNDPAAQVEYLTAVEKLKQLRSGIPGTNSSFGNLAAQARAAGLTPGSPEYQQFMLNGGGDPAAFRSLDMQAKAAGFQPGTPEYSQFMATRGAGLSAGASQTAKNQADIATGGEAERVKARGAAEGKIEAEKPQMRSKALSTMDALDSQRSIVNDSIDRTISDIKTNPKLTTGLVGGLSKAVPGTPAYTISKRLETIKANIGFDKLQSMRENSPTGGALGQVSDFENRQLQSVFGSLEQAQTSDELLYNLHRLQDILAQSKSARRRAFARDFGGALPDQSGQAQPADNAPTSGAPQPGTVMDGYRFKGGDPADQNNWERAQ